MAQIDIDLRARLDALADARLHDDTVEEVERGSRMPKSLKRGDVVEWNSEAGRVRGVIIKKVVSNLRFKGYVHHASATDPQYLIKSVKTDHIAIHKGIALKRVRAKKR